MSPVSRMYLNNNNTNAVQYLVSLVIISTRDVLLNVSAS